MGTRGRAAKPPTRTRAIATRVGGLTRCVEDECREKVRRRRDRGTRRARRDARGGTSDVAVGFEIRVVDVEEDDVDENDVDEDENDDNEIHDDIVVDVARTDIARVPSVGSDGPPSRRGSRRRRRRAVPTPSSRRLARERAARATPATAPKRV